MPQTIVRLNIEHYRNLLARETDETRRQAILRWLAEEEAKLGSLLDQRPEKKRRA